MRLFVFISKPMIPLNDELEQKLKALDSFKDWSNYLLITTVAALGWTAKKSGKSNDDTTKFCTPCMRTAAVFAFALSIVFAILTLALIPHVAELLEPGADNKYPSIYGVHWSGWCVNVRLTNLCLPQHVLFLLGIILYAVGTTFEDPKSWKIFSAALFAVTIVIFVAGNIFRIGW